MPEHLKHDGKAWVQLDIFPGFYAVDMIFANGYYYCLGHQRGPRILRADNALTHWTQVYEHLEPIEGQRTRIKYSMGEFTTVTSQSLLVSTNGVDWSASPAVFPAIAAVRTPSGYLLASFHGIFSSTNRASWTKLVDGNFVDVTYAHGTVIALRFDGEIFRANLEPH